MFRDVTEPNDLLTQMFIDMARPKNKARKKAGNKARKSKQAAGQTSRSSSRPSEQANVAHEKGGWADWFSIDLRSLAALRIVLGVLILADLIYRWPTWLAMCSDSGILPRATRAAWLESMPAVTQFGWSLHCLSGEAWWQFALFGLAAVFAGMLLVGYRSRIAVVGSWVLLASLHSRNPIIITSGDTYLKVVLFWSMFLPIAEVWSWDSRLRRRRIGQGKAAVSPVLLVSSKRSGRYASGATFGLISALFVLYFFPGIAKWNEIWLSGDAMEYVLRLDIYATEFGRSMLERPELLKWMSWSTLAVELAVPVALVLLWPFRVMRYLAIVCLVLLHVGIALCMDLGLFPYICVGIWVFTLPGQLWDRMGLKLPGTGSKNEYSPAESLNFYWLSALCYGLAVYFLCWNAAHFSSPVSKALMPEQGRLLTKALNMRQGFMMFDRPGNQSPWFVYEARLANGETVDVFRNSKPDHARPESVRATMPNMQWRRLHRNLVKQRYKALREPVAKYLMRRWNESHNALEQVEMLKVVFHSEQTIARGEPDAELTEVWFQHGEPTKHFDDLLEKIRNGGSTLPD